MHTIKSQTRELRKDITIDGDPVALVAHVRHDDSCKNGHNSFAITCDVYEAHRMQDVPTVQHSGGKKLWLSGCGCQHELVREFFPELAHLLKWHLSSTDGPMHYVANTVYHAQDRDHWGLCKDEVRQIQDGKTGRPSWKLAADCELPEYVDAETCPTETVTLRYVPWTQVGKGKERNLDAARSCAVWPDATDAELTNPGLKDRLEARLPALLAEFKQDIEAFGFTF